MISLQARVAGFLNTPSPSTLINVGKSATEDILATFARSGTVGTSKDRILLLDACIASNAKAADETESEEERRHFVATSRLLSEIKTAISTR
jgi:hypothetical protein